MDVNLYHYAYYNRSGTRSVGYLLASDETAVVNFILCFVEGASVCSPIRVHLDYAIGYMVPDFFSSLINSDRWPQESPLLSAPTQSGSAETLYLVAPVLSALQRSAINGSLVCNGNLLPRLTRMYSLPLHIAMSFSRALFSANTLKYAPTT